MRCLAVCHTELVVRLLDAVLTPSAELDVLVESAALARRFDEAGFGVRVGDPTRLDTYIKADLTPGTCVIIEDNGRRSLRKVVQAVRGAGGTLVWVLGTSPEDAIRADQLRETFPEITSLTLAELTGPPLLVELGRSITRQRVQQYQRFLSDADRVLILLHNDPDPDAIASGLALRNILRRTRQTAIIGCMYGVTRPENLRMLKLLDLQIEVMTAEQIKSFDRVALVDVQPHYFPGLLPQVDLVIDHHPEQSGYNAVFKDIRPDYGSTSTILTEHLRAVDIDISERTATAMLYAIKSDTLFFNRQANRADLDAFSYLYPLADATMIRKMEGSEITGERLDFVIKAWQHGRMVEHVFCAFIGEPSREDFIPYVADFYLQLENVQWSVISGVVNDMFIVSVRNLGYSRNAGDFVRRWFSDIGSAGGHRTMAKAVVPLEKFQQKFGTSEGSRINQRMLELVLAFLHEHGGSKDTKEPKDAKDAKDGKDTKDTKDPVKT
jgi:nanoRNase/pAp phosphatase (c-di-AMP/oligoRNAs hydrolase)